MWGRRGAETTALEPPCFSGRGTLDGGSLSAFTVRSDLKLERHFGGRRGFGLVFDVVDGSPSSSRRRRRRPSTSSTPSTSHCHTPFASLSIATATRNIISCVELRDIGRRGSDAAATAPVFASATTAFNGNDDNGRGGSGGRQKRLPSSSSSSPSSAARARNYLLHLAAGACSCAVARTTLAPLERMKLEQVLHGAAGLSVRETAERVWRSGVAAASASSSGGVGGILVGNRSNSSISVLNERARRLALGAAAFWRGNGVNLLRTCPHKAVNFFAFDTYRSALLTARRSRGRRDRRSAVREARRRLAAEGAARAASGARKRGGAEDEGRVEQPRQRRLFRLSLSSGNKDQRRGHHHHIHGAAPAPTTAHFEYDDSEDDSDSEVEFGVAERFAAGAMAGATATAICFPLDVLRTRVLLAAPAAASSAGSVVSAAARRAPAAVASAALSSSSAAALLRAIVANEGLGALYSGLCPALAATGPSGAIFYGTYDILKHLTLRAMERREEEEEKKIQLGEGANGRDRLLSFLGGGRRRGAGAVAKKKRDEPALMSARATLACGAAAGAAAELAMYPMEVIRRRMQVAAMQLAAAAAPASAAAASSSSMLRLRSATTFRGAAAALVAERGVAGLYAGVGPTMLQVLPSAALSYYAYEVFKSRFGVVSGVQ